MKKKEYHHGPPYTKAEKKCLVRQHKSYMRGEIPLIVSKSRYDRIMVLDGIPMRNA